MRLILPVLLIIALIFATWVWPRPSVPPAELKSSPLAVQSPSPSPLYQQIMLQSDYHVFQTFNNCGPAALSMALAYYDIRVSQQELGQILRPYQVQGGDNDDKSVTLSELATQAESYGLRSFYRPAGNIQLMKRLLALGLPVVTRTTTKPGEDIGHYRVLVGYDDMTGQLIQDDSLQGNNLRYSYPDFNAMWAVFNYEYLVLARPIQTEQVRAALGASADPQAAWQLARDTAPNPLSHSVALYHLTNYAGSVSAYEQVAASLPHRTLWYQIEPIQSYYELGRYDQVFTLTDQILSHGNRAASELYLLRGQSYQKLGQPDRAAREFGLALRYHANSAAAKRALETTP